MASSVSALSCAAEVATSRGLSPGGGTVPREPHQLPAASAQARARGTISTDRRRDRLMGWCGSGLGVDQEQRLSVLHRVSVLDEDASDAPAHLGLDLVHE